MNQACCLGFDRAWTRMVESVSRASSRSPLRNFKQSINSDATRAADLHATDFFRADEVFHCRMRNSEEGFRFRERYHLAHAKLLMESRIETETVEYCTHAEPPLSKSGLV